MAAGYWRVLLRNIREATSTKLQQRLASADAPRRARTVCFHQRIKMKSIEILEQKFAFWDNLPHLVLGVFSLPRGGSLDQARELAQRCVDEVELSEASGTLTKMHRVAQHLLADRSQPHTASFLKFARGEVDILEPELFIELQSYAMSPIVSRKVESPHASVKRVQAKAPVTRPPLVNLRLKQDKLMALVSNEDFMMWVRSQWHLRRLPAKLLAFCLSPEEKARIATGVVKTKCLDKRVYLYGVEATYRSSAPKRESLNEFKQATHDTIIPALEDISATDNLIANLLKSKFQFSDMVYSLPSAIFQNWTFDNLPNEGLRNIKEVVETMCAVEPSLANVEDPASLRFFIVVNARPEARRLVHQPHLVSRRAIVTVQPLHFVSADFGRLVVKDDIGVELKTLSLGGLCSPALWGNLFAWSREDDQPYPVLQPCLGREITLALHDTEVIPQPDALALEDALEEDLLELDVVAPVPDELEVVAVAQDSAEVQEKTATILTELVACDAVRKVGLRKQLV